MTIRELKDIPTKQVTITIPVQDFTEKEFNHYKKQWDKEIAEMNGCYINEDGRCIRKDKCYFLDKLFF